MNLTYQQIQQSQRYPCSKNLSDSIIQRYFPKIKYIRLTSNCSSDWQLSQISANKYNKESSKCQLVNKSLRGGGCGASKQQTRIRLPSQDYIVKKNNELPNYFMRDLNRHLDILIEKGCLAHDEREKEQILISIQWFVAMKEHFNTLCKDKVSATYDIIFESIPKLLKSTVTFLRVSGFLCIQILQIINDLARVVFTFFMTNDKRFMKIKDKQYLEELIADFENQINIEAQNIWVAGAEFEITMIKAVIQSSPSDSDEGKQLLISFIGGLVKSSLTMSPSEDLIDSLINGAKFLYQAYKTNNLKKKYEVDYYFQQLKWQVIQLLKQDVSAQNLIKYLAHAYKSYIENSQDWLINFCWVKMISSLLSYRPIISKQEVSNILIEQSRIWNQLLKQKYIIQFSFNSNIGRTQLIDNQQEKPTNQINIVLQKLGLKSFVNFQFRLLQIFQTQVNKYFSFGEINKSNQVQRDYLGILFEKNSDLDEQILQQTKLFKEQSEKVKQLREICGQLEKMNQGKDNFLLKEEVIIQIKSLINLSFQSFIQTINIRKSQQLQIMRDKLIIESINFDANNEELQSLKHQLLTYIKEDEEKQQNLGQLDEIIEDQKNIVFHLITLEVNFENIQVVGNLSQDYNIKQQINIFDELIQKIVNKIKEYHKIKSQLQNEKQKKLIQSQIIKINQESMVGYIDTNKQVRFIKFGLINPLLSVNQCINKIINMNTIKGQIQSYLQFYKNCTEQSDNFRMKMINLSSFKQLIQDLIVQMVNFKELLQQINQFLRQNIDYNKIQEISLKSPVVNEEDVKVMLQKQFKTILLYFSEEEKRIADDNLAPSIDLDQILTLLNEDLGQLQELQIENLDLMAIKQAIAFTEQFLQKYKQCPSKLQQMKQQIILIYQSFNIKSDEINLPQLNEKKQNILNQKEIENIKSKIDLLNLTVLNAIQACQNMQTPLSDQIQLYQSIQDIQFKLKLQKECENTFFYEYEAQLANSLNQQVKFLAEMRFNIPENIDIIEQNVVQQFSTDILDNLLLLIDQMQPKIVYYEQQDGNIVLEKINDNVSALLQEAQDIINDDDYKVRQCFIMGLFQMQSSSDEINLKKFCQDKIVYMWGFEKDERVKSILKNPQFLEMQKNLFAGDLKTFSQRLKFDMEQKFQNIDDLETRIRLEGDLSLRQKLQEELSQEHEEFESYLDNINDMESKLDIGLQFLKDLKRSLAQLKQKIDKLSEQLIIIGDDVRKLRGKSFTELLNIRKNKVLQSLQTSSLNQIYIPLQCQEWNPVTGHKIGDPSKLFQDIFVNQDGEINEFLQKDSKNKDVLLIRGVAGSGKSRAAGKIEGFLWEKNDTKEIDWVPIYISLPTIKEPKFNLLEQALESEFYQFDKIQIREFKEALLRRKLKIILILDSYDEMKQDCLQINLYHTNRMSKDILGNSSDLNGVKDYLKVIITTRTEILTSSSYQTWFYGDKLENLKEIELLGFDNDQKQKYLEEYTKLTLKREFLDLYNFVKQNIGEQFDHNEFLIFWGKVLECEFQIDINKNDYLLSQKQVNDICNLLKQEKCFSKVSKDQLMSLQKKLVDLWSVNKFQKLIKSAQIEHILTTPFMMEIVVQVLPSMESKYQNIQAFKEIFINNFVQLKKKEIQQQITLKEEKKLNESHKENVCEKFEEEDIKAQANKIWDQLQNEKYFSEFSLINKISTDDLSSLDSANIVIKALIIKKLSIFDFYLTFVEYYHFQQIKKQLELGRQCNQESFIIDLFNFSQSLALNMTLRQLSQVKNIQKGQLNLQFVKNSNEKEDWRDIYFNDFQSNGEYKKFIRSCILITQKGSNYSFSHKSIQEFFVGHFLLNILNDIELIDKKGLQDIIKLYKWENSTLNKQDQNDNQLNSDQREINRLSQKHLLQVQKFCLYISDSIFNQDKFNVSTSNYKGIMSLIRDELKQQQKLKQKLLQIVKLSAISNNDFKTAASNSMYLLGYNNELLRGKQLQNIQIEDIDLMGLSFYGSDLQGSIFKNVDISSCNFNNTNLINARWSDIKCNELNSIIWNQEVNNILFYQRGEFLILNDRHSAFSYNIQQGTYDTLVKKEDLEIFQMRYIEIDSLSLSQDEQLLAIGWKNWEGVIDVIDYVIQLWDMKRRRFLKFLEKLDVYLFKIILSIDGQYLVALADNRSQKREKIFLWNLKKNSKLTFLEGHENEVNCILLNSTGTVLYSCSSDATIRIWNLLDPPKEITVLKGHTDCVNNIVISHDNTLLASCSNDMTVRLWNVITFEGICIFQDHKEIVSQVYFQPDGKTLVSIGSNKWILVWSISQQKQLKCFERSSALNLKDITFSSDGKLFAYYVNNEINVLDINVGKIVAVFEGQLIKIQKITFKPGTYILATISSQDNKINFWDTQTEKAQNNFEGHRSEVEIIKFSPDSSILASWGKDQTLRIWNVKKGKYIISLNLEQIKINKIEFSNNSEYLFINTYEEYLDYDYIFWDAKRRAKLFIYNFNSEKLFTLDKIQHNQQLITSDIVFQPFGELIAWGVINDDKIAKIKLWNLIKRQEQFLLGHESFITGINFSSDGQILISKSDQWKWDYQQDISQVIVWKIEKFISVAQFNGVKQIVYSFNNQIIGLKYIKEPAKMIIYNTKEQVQLGILDNITLNSLSLSINTLYESSPKKIILWNIMNGKQIGSLDNKVVYSPNGDILVQYGKEQLLIIWEISTLNQIKSLEAHSDEIEGVIYSSDSNFFVSYSRDQTIILWETKEYTQKAILRQHKNKINTCFFSQNNQILVSVDEDDQIKLWDVQRGLIISNLEGNTFQIFSPNCSLFAFVSSQNEKRENNQITIWNIQDNKLQSVLVGDASKVSVQGFTSNNLQFIAFFDKCILLWDVKSGQLIELIDSSCFHQNIMTAMSLNNNIVASCSYDRIIQIWNAESGLLKTELIGHKHIVNCIAFSNDGSFLASGSKDSTIVIWKTKNWQQERVLNGHMNEVDYLIFTSDSFCLASGSKDNTIRLWDIQNGKQIQIIKEIKKIQKVSQIMFSLNEEIIVWFSVDQKSIQIQNLKDNSELIAIEIEDIIEHIFNFQSEKSLLIFRSKRIIYFWDITQGIKFSTEGFGYPQSITFHLSNNLFSGIFENNPREICIWNYNQNKKLTLDVEHTNKINQVEFSPNHQMLASCSDDGMIKLWDLSPIDQQTQQLEKTIQCFKTLSIYQPITASQCKISGAVIKSKIGNNLNQLFIQKGAIEQE